LYSCHHPPSPSKCRSNLCQLRGRRGDWPPVGVHRRPEVARPLCGRARPPLPIIWGARMHTPLFLSSYILYVHHASVCLCAHTLVAAVRRNQLRCAEVLRAARTICTERTFCCCRPCGRASPFKLPTRFLDSPGENDGSLLDVL
jgi:hypothetical protein